MKINTVELKTIAVRESQYPTDLKPEFLLVGRSNVGKSSFINTIVQRKNYAHTSATPGKTKTLNFYSVNEEFYLVDVPGYGYALGSHDTQHKFGMMIEEYIVKRTNLKRVFLLIDSKVGPTEDDELMFNYLKYYKLPVTIIATKSDKVKQSLKAKTDKMLNSAFELTETDNIIYFSSVEKTGREEVYATIEQNL